MSQKKKGSSFNSDKSEYAVGYGKPPKEKRFKPGTSGNPKGRPKAEPSTFDEFNKITRERIDVEINGIRRHITKRNAVIRSIVNFAIKGKARAVDIVLRHLATQTEAQASLTEASEWQDDTFRVICNLLDKLAKEKAAPAYQAPRAPTPLTNRLLETKK